MSDTSAVRLTYFHGRGLGEKVRWMLAAANIEFEQRVLYNREEFLSLRDSGKLLFHQLPLLEIDGLNLTQHRSTYRYIAERANLYGDSIAMKATCDMICEFMHDLSYAGYIFRPNKEDYMKGNKQTFDKKLPILESIIGNPEVYPRGPNVTPENLLASDVIIAEVLSGFQDMLGKDILDGYPLTKQLVESVCELPQLKAYLESAKHYSFPRGKAGDIHLNNVEVVLGRR